MARNSASARPLTDHDEILRWAEERNARPACVRDTANNGDVGMIRLDFPGYSGGQSLDELSWDDWFQKFDESNLALLVQDETAGGQKSNFNKLVSRETAGLEAGSRRRSGSSSSKSSSSKKRAGSKSEAGEYVGSDLDEDVDEDFEEELDLSETRPVRTSGVGDASRRNRQARTTAGRGTRSRGTATARRSRSQSGRSRSPRRTTARGTSNKSRSKGSRRQNRSIESRRSNQSTRNRSNVSSRGRKKPAGRVTGRSSQSKSAR